MTGRDRDGEDRPRRPRRDGDRDRAPGGGDRRPPRSGPGSGPGERRPRTDRPTDRDGDRPARGPGRPQRERPAPPPKPKAKKLRPGRTHRDALLASLPPEQQSVGEQVLRGGMPAVRSALEEQNSAARAEGQPEMPSESLLSMAEAVLPRARVAEWLDRAEAALADADELALRDLRSVVVSADDVARDEATRPLAAQLREVLERRTGAEQEEWLSDLTSSLEGGRVVRALRLSSRPPEPSASLPAELSARLSEAAGAAMTDDIAPDRWATVLDAVAYSPVRRAVTPAGVPAEPGDELLAAVRKHAGRVPAIAEQFGIAAPPSAGSSARRSSSSSRPARAPRPARTSVPATAAPVAAAGPPLPPGVRRIPPPPPAMLRGRPIPPPPGPHRPVADATDGETTWTPESAAPEPLAARAVEPLEHAPSAAVTPEPSPPDERAPEATTPEAPAAEAPAARAVAPFAHAPAAADDTAPDGLPAPEAAATPEPSPPEQCAPETEATAPTPEPLPAEAPGAQAVTPVEHAPAAADDTAPDGLPAPEAAMPEPSPPETAATAPTPEPLAAEAPEARAVAPVEHAPAAADDTEPAHEDERAPQDELPAHEATVPSVVGSAPATGDDPTTNVGSSPSAAPDPSPS